MAQSYKKWVETLVAKIALEMNLNEWRVECIFDDEEDETAGTIAYINTDSRYMNAWINFTPLAEQFWLADRDRLVQCIIHEITHIILNPLHEFAKQAASPQTEEHLMDILENATQKLSRIVKSHLPKNFFNI